MNALTLNAPIAQRLAPRQRTAATHPGLIERAFAVVVLFLATGGLLPLLGLEASLAVDDLEGDRVMQVTWIAVYAITMLLLARRTRETVGLLCRERWLGLLCGLAATSILWSVATDVTLRRTAALFGTTAFGIYLASRYTAHELLRLVAWVLSAAAILSVVASLFFPGYGISIDDGAWRGIFVHKNALGRAMALSCLVLLFKLRHGVLLNRLILAGVLALAAVALLGSSSVAGFLTAMVVVVTIPLWPIFRLRRAPAVAAAVFALMAIIGAGIWLSTVADVMVAAVGKDPGLTGRTALWAAVQDAIASRPWLGHGYSAFWLGWDGESAAVWSALQWKPPHAHNGFLDLTLELGIVGVVLLVGGLVTAAWRAALLIRRSTSIYALWPVVYLVFIIVVNLAESTILVRNSIFWMLYVVTCMWLTRAKNDASRMAA